jgi:hypothetical protein
VVKEQGQDRIGGDRKERKERGREKEECNVYTLYNTVHVVRQWVWGLVTGRQF